MSDELLIIIGRADYASDYFADEHLASRYA
jgi:hypothetical protein